MSSQSLAEQAYAILKEKITVMDEGTHLSLRTLSKETGIGYTPIREAFLRLEQEGYLKQIPRVGFFVQKMSTHDIVQYYQVRECIEPYVLANAFSSLDETHIKALEKSLAAQEKALKKNDYAAFVREDIEFHKIPFIAYGNAILTELYESIREKFRICSPVVIEKKTYPLVLKEHEKMLDDIRRGDLDACRKHLEEHLSETEQRARSYFINVLL